jgi:hypothetical protein
MQPLSDVEKCYWSTEAFQRCLRATKWVYDAAVKRAEETCVWRREFGVEEMGPERVSEEGETGKELVFGFDVQSRPVLYMVSRRSRGWARTRDLMGWFFSATVSSEHGDGTSSD